MTIFFNYPGVDLGNTTVRLVPGGTGILGLTTAADGDKAASGIQIDDPAGVLTLANLQTFSVNETDCSQPRTYTGLITNLTVDRGPYINGAGRVWEFDVEDLNYLLHLRVLRGASAKRPQESGTARINWLLSSVALSGLVYDNGMIGTYASTFTFDVADYTGQYADDVLNNIVAESGTLGRIFFVYWNAANAQPSLFFMSPTAALRDSTLRIANVAADLDSVTFKPSKAGTLKGQGDDIYDGVLVKYTGGIYYKQLASTYATYPVHRDFVLETTRLNNLTTATANANHFLERHTGRFDTITCVVQLPSASVNLLEAGMRVQVKFSHLPGYTAFTWTRVSRRTVTLAEGTNQFYNVQLELSTKGINQTGGGNPGTLPFVGCSTATVGYVQSAMAGATNVVLPATPIVGNTLLWLVAGRTTGTYVPPAGTWTQRGPSHACNRNVAGDYPIKIYSKPVEVTDTATITLTPNITTGSRGMMMEILGAPTYDVGGGASTVYGVNDTVSITPTAGKVAILVSLGVVAQDAGSPVGWAAPASGMTEVADTGPPAPQVAVNYQVVAATSGSYTVGSTGNINVTGDTAAVIGVAFYCSGTDVPVGQGQWVFDEVPTPAPDGTTTTFTFANAFADGSMRIKVDLLDQTGSISSYDGAAKTITLLFAPKVGEKLTGTYQGR